MAIIKRTNGSYQTKYRGQDGCWISRTFLTKREAETFELSLKQQKRSGSLVTNDSRTMTLDEFFALWVETTPGQASAGWIKTRRQQYAHFVQPLLGRTKLQSINPPMVARVLGAMAENEKAAQTRLHVFNLLKKLFRDAQESFRLVTFNPVLRIYKPQIPSKEAVHLNLRQVRELLTYVSGKAYGDAIWLQFFLGLRVGELQALKSEDVGIEMGVVHIRRCYVRKESVFKDYPKGRKQHSKPIPQELLGLLGDLKSRCEPGELLLKSAGWHMLSYEWYQRSLRRYCKELGLPLIGTHGLRHSTPALYLSGGASREDIRTLFAHSSDKVTERYLHAGESSLGNVAKVIRLFPDTSQIEGSQNVPIRENGVSRVDEI